MAATDIEAGLRLCRASGWNQLEADWRCFLEGNPLGCRVAECDGRVAGTVTTLNFEDRFSWISMVLVEPELRGRGIGTGLLQEALRLLSGLETVRLDATPAGKLVYDKVGFRDEYRLVRMKAPPLARDRLREASMVRPTTAGDLPPLMKLDRSVFGADRSVVLRHLYGSAPEYAFLAGSASEIQGFAFGRHGFNAEHVGPVVAVDEPVARSLVAACMAQNPDRPFILDAPQHSAAWSGWLESAGFRPERPFIRMFLGTNSHPGLPGMQFAIAGPEFG